MQRICVEVMFYRKNVYDSLKLLSLIFGGTNLTRLLAIFTCSKRGLIETREKKRGTGGGYRIEFAAISSDFAAKRSK